MPPTWPGLGALRAGADIVRIASPVFEPVPDLIYERLFGDRIGEEHTERLIALAEQADVVVCGNGLGTESHEVVLAVAPHCKKAVFDADALRLPLPKAAQRDRVHPACRGICPYRGQVSDFPVMQAMHAGRARAAKLRRQRLGAPSSSKGPWTSSRTAAGSGLTGPVIRR